MGLLPNRLIEAVERGVNAIVRLADAAEAIACELSLLRQGKHTPWPQESVPDDFYRRVLLGGRWNVGREQLKDQIIEAVKVFALKHEAIRAAESNGDIKEARLVEMERRCTEARDAVLSAEANLDAFEIDVCARKQHAANAGPQ